MEITILGGGLAGISLAYFLQDRQDIAAINILEKETELGGLCRSFEHNNTMVDIGPHIFFSKDKETLKFMLDLLGENKHELRRSNRIIHKGAFVQYPFENDLSKLPKEDTEKCLKGFLNNPYKDYTANNMLQFFLKTFGDGITNLYLRPYNEKIWKFDPTFMDTQMVERIPKPPDEDIINSANGQTIDGYTHQLYFSYPKEGGTGAFIDAFVKKLNSKVKIYTSAEVTAVSKVDQKFKVTAGGKEYISDTVASCLPVNILANIYNGTTTEVKERANNLRYNNIIIAMVTVKNDHAGDNYAFMTADKDVIFHRISKVDFLGENYSKDGTTYMLEYTYRDGDLIANLPEDELKAQFADGLKKIGFIENDDEIMSFTLNYFPYAYVIYDLLHKENMTVIREYFKEQGLYLNGRFGNFEYLNMDRIIPESKKVAEQI